MPEIWPRLYQDRVAWSDRAAAWLTREVFAEDEGQDLSQVAQAMVVGATQSGKTTLLLRLLGIEETGDAAQASEVLRGHRDHGYSATAFPIRYRWSDKADEWALTRDGAPERWLSDATLAGELAAMREEAYRWEPSHGPVEIGFPRRYLGDEGERAELRVLDLPGLWADDARERDQVGQIVSRYAMSMNLIVFVHRADAMAGDFNDEVITENTVLSAWRENPDGYRVVLTRAYSVQSLRTEMLHDLGDEGLTPARVLAYARTRLAHQLSASAEHGDPDDLATRIYPIELGRTMEENFLDHPELAAVVRQATDLAIDQLRQDIARSAGDDDGYFSHVSYVARRVTDHVRRRRQAREVHLAGVRHELERTQQAATSGDAQLEDCRQDRDQAAARLQTVKAGYGSLTTTGPRFERPAAPAMKAVVVRAHQEKERTAWLEAADRSWAAWSQLVADSADESAPLPIAAPALRKKYDECVGCCGECSDSGRRGLFKTVGRPQACYGRMTEVTEPMSSWLRQGFGDAAAPTVTGYERVLADADERVDAATRLAERARVGLAGAVRAVEAAEADAADQAVRDEHDEMLAQDVFGVLRREHAQYVDGLVQQMADAEPAERGWFAVAALLAHKELEGMVAS